MPCCRYADGTVKVWDVLLQGVSTTVRLAGHRSLTSSSCCFVHLPLYPSHLPSHTSDHIPLSNYVFIIHIQQFEPVKNRESHAAMSHTTSTRQRISSLKVRTRFSRVLFLPSLLDSVEFHRRTLQRAFALFFVCLGTATTPLNSSTSILDLSNEYSQRFFLQLSPDGFGVACSRLLISSFL